MWFMTTMKFFSKRPACGAIHLVNGYDWSVLQEKVVVDVSRPLWADLSRLCLAHLAPPILCVLLFRTAQTIFNSTHHCSVEALLVIWPQRSA